MPSVNRITIMGHLGKDPELRHTQGGKPFCTFSVATTEKYNDTERTEWHEVAVFTKSAEACHKYLFKGALVYVEGKLQSREAEKNGVKVKYWNISAFDVKFLSKRPEGAGATAAGGAFDDPFANDQDSDIPF